MKRGFKQTMDLILRGYGLRTDGLIGTILSDGDYSWLALNAMGYRVEKGISNPTYDYIVMSKEKSTLTNVLECLTKIKEGCIIVYRVDGKLELSRVMYDLNKTSDGLSTSFFGYGDDKILAVTFKGKKGA